MGGELKLGMTVLQIQLVFWAGIEPVISDSKSGVLTTGHTATLRERCTVQKNGVPKGS